MLAGLFDAELKLLVVFADIGAENRDVQAAVLALPLDIERAEEQGICLAPIFVEFGRAVAGRSRDQISVSIGGRLLRLPRRAGLLNEDLTADLHAAHEQPFRLRQRRQFPGRRDIRHHEAGAESGTEYKQMSKSFHNPPPPLAVRWPLSRVPQAFL